MQVCLKAVEFGQNHVFNLNRILSECGFRVWQKVLTSEATTIHHNCPCKVRYSSKITLKRGWQCSIHLSGFNGNENCSSEGCKQTELSWLTGSETILSHSEATTIHHNGLCKCHYSSNNTLKWGWQCSIRLSGFYDVEKNLSHSEASLFNPKGPCRVP